MRAHARLRLRQLTMLALVALTLGALHVEGAQLLHLHGGDRQGGIFTEQHVLATLFATSSSGAPLPAAAAGALLVLLAGFIALPEDVRLPPAPGGHAPPRAPPGRAGRPSGRRASRAVPAAPRPLCPPTRRSRPCAHWPTSRCCAWPWPRCSPRSPRPDRTRMRRSPPFAVSSRTCGRR